MTEQIISYKLTTVDPQVRTALSIFNAAYNNNIERHQKITLNKNRMKELKVFVDEYKALEEENKELHKEIQKDRDYVSRTIEFYENQTGNSIGTGDLFNQTKGEENNDLQNV